MGDLHHPHHTQLFKQKLEGLESVDLFLLAGDNTDPGHTHAYQEITRVCSRCAEKVVGVFGNTEQPAHRQQIRRDNPAVTFLEEEAAWVDDLYVVGSQGVLDQPTRWQQRNTPDIHEVYQERQEKLRKLLQVSAPKKLLLTHYLPTQRTMNGEPKGLYPLLGHDMEPLLSGVDVAVHAHSHYGQSSAKIGDTWVYNASFPLTRNVIVFEL